MLYCFNDSRGDRGYTLYYIHVPLFFIEIQHFAEFYYFDVLLVVFSCYLVSVPEKKRVPIQINNGRAQLLHSGESSVAVGHVQSLLRFL